MGTQKFMGHVGDANSIRFARDGNQNIFVTCSTDKTCRVWDARNSTQAATHTFEASGECNGAAFFPSGQAVAACCHDGKAFLWDLRTQNKLQVFGRNGSKVSACDFSKSGRIFYCGYEDGHVGLWDTFGSGGIKHKVTAHTDNEVNNKIVSQTRVSPDGTAFAT